ncbi:DNA-binding HTH domain-containing proteins [Microbacterium testaceum StLB037]|uniref:DNA-binding HTH domain-containing proteins n=1 Tax=Microbacterium testaceum (strain StLB037) TaxID=979556 RepID=E8N6N0_MICTS|nr:DNA-binding HTH domain-containing proteins [Microbacterium testaceum StLB037]
MNASTLPTVEAAAIFDLNYVRSFPMRTEPQNIPKEEVSVLSAALIAHARMDDIESCSYLLGRYWRHHHLRSSVSLDRREMFFLEANAAEAYCALGDVSTAALHARRALSMSANAAETFRAKSVLALCLSLRGNMAAASGQISKCDGLARRNDPSWSHDSYVLSVARSFVLANEGDADGLRRAAADLRGIGGRDDYVQYAADVVSVQAYVLSGQIDEAVCLGSGLLDCGSSRGRWMMRGFLLSLYLDALLLRGEPRRALAVASGIDLPTPPIVCLEAPRALAFLMTADYRSALRVTQPCLRRVSELGLRAAVAIMLVRGVAQYRLGEHVRARRSLTDGLRMAARARLSPALIIGLAAVDLRDVAEWLGDVTPEAAEFLSRLEQYRGSLPNPPSPSVVPVLTSREESLAWSIYDGASNKEISEKDGVSVNTVKVQLSTLYRKLGVSTRKQALAFLDEREFFLPPVDEQSSANE